MHQPVYMDQDRQPWYAGFKHNTGALLDGVPMDPLSVEKNMERLQVSGTLTTLGQFQAVSRRQQQQCVAPWLVQPQVYTAQMPAQNSAMANPPTAPLSQQSSQPSLSQTRAAVNSLYASSSNQALPSVLANASVDSPRPRGHIREMVDSNNEFANASFNARWSRQLSQASLSPTYAVAATSRQALSSQQSWRTSLNHASAATAASSNAPLCRHSLQASLDQISVVANGSSDSPYSERSWPSSSELDDDDPELAFSPWWFTGFDAIASDTPEPPTPERSNIPPPPRRTQLNIWAPVSRAAQEASWAAAPRDDGYHTFGYRVAPEPFYQNTLFLPPLPAGYRNPFGYIGDGRLVRAQDLAGVIGHETPAHSANLFGAIGSERPSQLKRQL